MIKKSCVCSSFMLLSSHEGQVSACNKHNRWISKERDRVTWKRKVSIMCWKEKAVPEVLLKVVEAKRLIESGKIASVQEATEKVGISRSFFFINIKMIFFHFRHGKRKDDHISHPVGWWTGAVVRCIKDSGRVFMLNILTIHRVYRSTVSLLLHSVWMSCHRLVMWLKC